MIPNIIILVHIDMTTFFLLSNLDDIIESIKKRDYNDMHKPVGALKRTDDQIYIDSTKMSIEEVVDKMIKYIKGE